MPIDSSNSRVGGIAEQRVKRVGALAGSARNNKVAAAVETEKAADMDEFKAKLSLVLCTPQGEEIKRRNWRVSDKFCGGQSMEDYRQARKKYTNVEAKQSKVAANVCAKDDYFDQVATGRNKTKSTRLDRKQLRKAQEKFDHLL